MRQLTGHALHQRTTTIQSVLEAIGSVEFEDAGGQAAIRRQRWLVTVPGVLDLADEALLKYEEWFEADGRAWLLLRYHFDFFDLTRGGRFAYHLHDLPGRGVVPHIHCRPAGSEPKAAQVAHYRAYEIDLLEAHERFAAILAAGAPIICVGLLPLPGW